ncbi:hypothetical protein C8R48DRAFT_768703 [Suillus tomentosus]|nr:hypothetical protein C8R48DRAFT_768703 [Suillus tomentosus]
MFCWKKRQDSKGNGVMGKDVLQELIKDYHAEYRELTDNEKDEILLKYSEHKKTQTAGIQISTKSRINDVTSTLKAVENELNNLRNHTGAKAILYATHGSMDLPLCSVAFTTERMEEFMTSGIKAHSIPLLEQALRKIIKSAALMFTQRSVSKFRNSKGLVEITKDEGAKMHWTNYFQSVVQHYQVIIEGWPVKIPFVNLSKASSALPDLKMLEWKWRAGTICWREIDEEELLKLLEECNEKLESWEIVDHRHRKNVNT